MKNLIVLSDAALFQYHQLCNMQQPTSHDLNALRYWLSRPEGGDFLQGVEGHAWDPEKVHTSDLVAMHAEHQERDLFSSFLATKCMTALHRCKTFWQPVRLARTLKIPAEH